MITEGIVIQSAGSLSIALLALIMMILQIILLLRKPQLTWYGWSAAISFSAMLYAIGVFIEYNAPPGPVNRFAGQLVYTAVICLIHSFYGLSFAYLEINNKYYHVIAGIFHCLVLVLLWAGDSIIAYTFVGNNLIGLSKPYIETDMGPLGILFLIYCILASIGALLLWIIHKKPVRYRTAFVSGMILWIVLGIHDGLSSMGMPTFQYLMEYGLLGFSIIVLWVVLNNYVNIEEEDKYRVITEYANDGMMVLREGIVIFGNPASSAIIGRPVIGLSINDFLDTIAPEDRQLVLKHYIGLFDSIDNPETLIIHIKRTDDVGILEINGTLINYKNSPAVLIILRDVTEKIHKEEELRESEEKINRLKKMESLGIMAGGVAHDLNNVLSGIVSYPELILLKLPKDSDLKKPIETIQEAGKRSAAIIQDFLTVARGVAVHKEPLNLNDEIMEYLDSPEYKKLLQYHPSVTIMKDLDSRLLNIKGSPIHIKKAVMNLISNASEAIKGAGKVVVSTANRYLDRPLKGYEDLKTGEYAVLIVEDNGGGISPDDLKRIFEPFFTKKVMGRSGTGLGLTLVWNIVKDHEGYIDIISDARGTKFELYFPVTREAVADRKMPVPLGNLYGHGETILVIDDIDSQREISCLMLETLRYKTKAVAGGEEAIEYLKDNSVDLLLLDMIMDPGINGRETYERIKKIHPAQKAIIVSGFAETDQVKETIRLGAGRFIKKPLILEELGMAVKQELGNQFS